MVYRETMMPAARAILLFGFAILCPLAATLYAGDEPAAGASATQTAKGFNASKPTPEEEDAAERSYPSLPGAVRKLPEWLKKNAPFDVVRYFVVVPPEENAAPLYLEALYEFSPREMAQCVSPEEHEARGPPLIERVVRDNLAEYQGGFEKLAAAQKRKRCVFETGLRFDTRLPHAQESRTVLRLLERRVGMHIAEGSIDAALDDIEMAFRLSRDLRPRGPLMCQMVSIALDTMTTTQSLVPKVLAAPRLRIDECDRLLELLIRHETESRNPLTEGYRTEYLMIRDVLYRLELKESLGDLVGTPGTSNGIVLARWYSNGAGTKSLEFAEQIDELLARMTAKDFASEVESLNSDFVPLVKRENFSLLDPDRQLSQDRRPAERTKLVDFLESELFRETAQATEAYRRNLTRLGATQCLVALRRWQIKHGKEPPPDLLTVCKAAGMKAIPVDYYSENREPLLFITSGADWVVYSVAEDGKDDKARLDWNFGQQKGDWIFRMPVMAVD
jgi:hypothetical protein